MLSVLVAVAAGAAMLLGVGWFVYKGIFEARIGTYS